MKEALLPTGSRVAVIPDKAKEVTESGIIIPNTVREKQQRGTIAAVGVGTEDEPMERKVGDVVVYGVNAGTPTNFNGIDYLIMRQSDILYVIRTV